MPPKLPELHAFCLLLECPAFGHLTIIRTSSVNALKLLVFQGIFTKGLRKRCKTLIGLSQPGVNGFRT